MKKYVLLLLFINHSIYSVDFSYFFEKISLKTSHLSFWHGCMLGGCVSLCFGLGMYSIHKLHHWTHCTDEHVSNPITMHDVEFTPARKITKSDIRRSLNKFSHKEKSFDKDLPRDGLNHLCLEFNHQSNYKKYSCKQKIYERRLSYLCLASQAEFNSKHYNTIKFFLYPLFNLMINYHIHSDDLFEFLCLKNNVFLTRDVFLEWERWKNVITHQTAYVINNYDWKALLLFGFKDAHTKIASEAYIRKRCWLIYACLKAKTMPSNFKQFKQLWYEHKFEEELSCFS